MDLPGFVYLYTLATLAMTFVGFCAVVFVLRQGRVKKQTGIHILHSHGYIEIALSSAAAAMLPPLLAVCGLSSLQVWQWSSAIIAFGLIAHTAYTLGRFFKIVSWRIPTHALVNWIITALVVVALIGNIIGYPNQPSVGPIAVAATWRLIMAIEVFFLTLEVFL
jgi:hypothetical protein